MTERILNKIENYTYAITVKKELEEQLARITYKCTPTYGNVGGGATGFKTSKVETNVIHKDEIQRKINRKDAEIKEIENLINGSGLTEQEKEVLWCVAREEHLSSYARYYKIYLSNVYKIRDRALKKIAAALKPQNVL